MPPESASKTPVPTAQAKTPKAEQTRRNILEAAGSLFGARGFKGATISDIEDAAGVNRGLINYHFGSKEGLWKAVVTSHFTEYMNELEAQRDVLRALKPAARLSVAIRNFVRFSVRHPHLSKIMIQENLDPSWRQDWILDRFLTPIERSEREVNVFKNEGTSDYGPALRYALIGACTMPFTVAPEIRKMYGVDVFGEAFIEELVTLITRAFVDTAILPGEANVSRSETGREDVGDD